MKNLFILTILAFASITLAQTSQESIFDTINITAEKLYIEKAKSIETGFEKPNYNYYDDLTLKNKTKIRACGLLFTTLGATGIIANIIDANRKVSKFNYNYDEKTKSYNPKETKVKNGWTKLHTFTTCYSSIFLISGLTITINY